MPDIITSREQWIEMNKRKDIDARRRGVRCARPATLCAEVGAHGRDRRAASKYGRTTQNNVRVMGITENIPPHRHACATWSPAATSIQDDIDQARTVAVIGTDLVDAFFGRMEPLGKEILIDGHPFKVVGVAEKKGSVFGESQDNFVWMPDHAPSARSTARGARSPSRSRPRSMAVFEEAQDQARVAMRVRRHLDYGKPDDFDIETGESVMDLWQSATRGIYVVTIVVTAISLAGGRHRGHEHHAGLGHRAHPRDRRAQGAGRAPPRHPAPVPGRVGDPLGLRRASWASLGAAVFSMGLARRPRRHHVRRLLGPGAAVGGAAGALRLHRGGPRGRASIRRAAPPPSTPWTALRNE